MAKKIEETPDYSAFEDVKPHHNIMTVISGLCRDVLAKEAEISKAEAALAKLNEELLYLTDKRLPELMQDCKLEKTTTDGMDLELKLEVHAGIPAANPIPSLTWLEENKHGNLIKREFKIEFNKDEEKWADKFERDLASRKKAVRVERKKGVNPGTLKKFVRELLEAGTEFPQDLFQVFTFKRAKVKLAKD